MSDLIEITDEPRHSCPYGCEGDCDVPEHLRGQRDYFARVAELAQEQIERLKTEAADPQRPVGDGEVVAVSGATDAPSPDKCPTCGSADPTDRPIVRRHDLHERQGNYLEPAHTPCPDRFHRPRFIANAPDTQERACGDDNCYPPADRVPCENCPDFAPDAEPRRWLLYWKPGMESWPKVRWGDSPRENAQGYVTVPVVEARSYDAAQAKLHEVERERDQARSQLTTLREAVEACVEGLLRAGDKARRALASLDEQGGSDE